MNKLQINSKICLFRQIPGRDLKRNKERARPTQSILRWTQIANSKRMRSVRGLGHWNFVFIWNLLLGIWDFQNFSSKKNSGFTILETMIALAVITAAVVGPVSLITRGIASSSFSKNKLIANHLAAEGIELIRVIRENNIICIAGGAGSSWHWDTDYDGNSRLHAGLTTNKTIDGVELSPPILSPPMQCAPGIEIRNPTRSIGSCNTNFLNIDSSGCYTHGSGGAPTIFKRCVWVSKDPLVGEGSIPGTDIINVSSEVKWSERGIQKSILLQERLYNWR